jgi:hypothetical protein
MKQLLADGHLKVLRGEKSNAEKAILKIDPDLQFLLDKARENGSVVIRSAPVHKLGSLLEEVADLSSYSDVMTDTRAALDLVRAKVVATVAQGAEAYLSQVDQGWSSKPNLTNRSTVYLDHLTVAYFDHVGILAPFADAVAEVYVTQDIESEANAVLRASEISENLLAAIDRIRSVLNEGLEKRTVVFSSRKPLDDDDDAHDNAYDRRFPSLDIMADLRDVDVVVCDDRFLNKDLFWTNETHRVPCANTLDLISALNNRAKISRAQKYEYLHRGLVAITPYLSSQPSFFPSLPVRFSTNRDWKKRPNLPGSASTNPLRSVRACYRLSSRNGRILLGWSFTTRSARYGQAIRLQRRFWRRRIGFWRSCRCHSDLWTIRPMRPSGLWRSRRRSHSWV